MTTDTRMSIQELQRIADDLMRKNHFVEWLNMSQNRRDEISRMKAQDTVRLAENLMTNGVPGREAWERAVKIVITDSEMN